MLYIFREYLAKICSNLPRHATSAPVSNLLGFGEFLSDNVFYARLLVLLKVEITVRGGVGVLRHVLQSRITAICGGVLCWRRLSSSFVAKWHVNDYFIEKGSNTMFTSDVYPQEKNISTGLHASYYGIHLASDQSDQDIKLKALSKATYITSSCFADSA